MKIYCIGDSLTEGDYGIKGKSGIANVHEKNYPYFLKELTGADVVNLGKCGWRSSTMLNWHKDKGFCVSDADKIIVMLGTNGGQSSTEDSDENKAYKELISRLKAEAPKAKLYLCTPPHVTENPQYSNCGYAHQVGEAVAFVRKFAGENKMTMIDLAADSHFTAETEETMQPNDGLHFGEEGYRTLAGVIYNAIKE